MWCHSPWQDGLCHISKVSLRTRREALLAGNSWVERRGRYAGRRGRHAFPASRHGEGQQGRRGINYRGRAPASGRWGGGSRWSGGRAARWGRGRGGVRRSGGRGRGRGAACWGWSACWSRRCGGGRGRSWRHGCRTKAPMHQTCRVQHHANTYVSARLTVCTAEASIRISDTWGPIGQGQGSLCMHKDACACAAAWITYRCDVMAAIVIQCSRDDWKPHVGSRCRTRLQLRQPHCRKPLQLQQQRRLLQSQGPQRVLLSTCGR